MPRPPALSHAACLPTRAAARRAQRCGAAVGAVGALGNAPVELLATAEQLHKWVAGQGASYTSLIEPKRFKADAGGERLGFIASRDTQEGEVLLQLPEAVAVTSVDAEAHPLVGPVAKECSELIALALWLLAEREAGTSSQWAPLLHTLPEATNSPILWDDAERAELLQGSRVLGEARSRQSALQQQWAQLQEKYFAQVCGPCYARSAAACNLLKCRAEPFICQPVSSQATVSHRHPCCGAPHPSAQAPHPHANNPLAPHVQDPARFPPTTFNEAAFMRAFSVVLASATYLPAAECFALLPLAGLMGRTGNDNGCDLDFDAASGCVVVRAGRQYRWVVGERRQ